MMMVSQFNPLDHLSNHACDAAAVLRVPLLYILLNGSYIKPRLTLAPISDCAGEDRWQTEAYPYVVAFPKQSMIRILS